MKWVVQAVPGMDATTDGETLDLSNGSARVSFAPTGERTLIFTALPKNDSAFDPEEPTDIRYPLSLEIQP